MGLMAEYTTVIFEAELTTSGFKASANHTFNNF